MFLSLKLYCICWTRSHDDVIACDVCSRHVTRLYRCSIRRPGLARRQYLFCVALAVQRLPTVSPPLRFCSPVPPWTKRGPVCHHSGHALSSQRCRQLCFFHFSSHLRTRVVRYILFDELDSVYSDEKRKSSSILTPSICLTSSTSTTVLNQFRVHTLGGRLLYYSPAVTRECYYFLPR